MWLSWERGVFGFVAYLLHALPTWSGASFSFASLGRRPPLGGGGGWKKTQKIDTPPKKKKKLHYLSDCNTQSNLLVTAWTGSVLADYQKYLLLPVGLETGLALAITLHSDYPLAHWWWENDRCLNLFCTFFTWFSLSLLALCMLMNLIVLAANWDFVALYSLHFYSFAIFSWRLRFPCRARCERKKKWNRQMPKHIQFFSDVFWRKISASENKSTPCSFYVLEPSIDLSRDKSTDFPQSVLQCRPNRSRRCSCPDHRKQSIDFPRSSSNKMETLCFHRI